ncbi:MAG: nucleotidyltransferase domain-containing protein [Thermodesulfovibrionales bacterium]|nr:nucleotidyltransferase domain-containing protein [Thermodesulfovibrionales bacterium]
MTEKDREIILELKRRLPSDVRRRVKKFIVFGSRARGQAREDSDLDMIVLLDEREPEVEKQLDDIAYSVMWDYDFKPIMSLKVFAESKFKKAVEKGFSFYKMVEREGVSL